METNQFYFTEFIYLFIFYLNHFLKKIRQQTIPHNFMPKARLGLLMIGPKSLKPAFMAKVGLNPMASRLFLDWCFNH